MAEPPWLSRYALLDNLNKVYAPARATTPEAYVAAQKALKMKEDLTFASDEIDMFLPDGLRRNKSLISSVSNATGARVRTVDERAEERRGAHL